MPKEKVKTPKLRKPFYALSDSAIGLKGATVGMNDHKLKNLVKELNEVKDKIHRHLEANYIWD